MLVLFLLHVWGRWPWNRLSIHLADVNTCFLRNLSFEALAWYAKFSHQDEPERVFWLIYSSFTAQCMVLFLIERVPTWLSLLPTFHCVHSLYLYWRYLDSHRIFRLNFNTFANFQSLFRQKYISFWSLVRYKHHINQQLQQGPRSNAATMIPSPPAPRSMARIYSLSQATKNTS